MQADAEKPFSMNPDELPCCKRLSQARERSMHGLPADVTDVFQGFVKAQSWMPAELASTEDGDLQKCRLESPQATAFHYRGKAVDDATLDAAPVLTAAADNAMAVPPLIMQSVPTSSSPVVYILDPIERLLLAYDRLEGLFRIGSN